jgi:hypothetical protein
MWQVRQRDLASGNSNGTLCPDCRRLPENNPNWRGGIQYEHYRHKLQTIANHPKEHECREITRKAIRAGVIKRGCCELDDNSKAECHHDNYNNPLEVRWLCQKHHKALHRMRRKGVTMKRFECLIQVLPETLQPLARKLVLAFLKGDADNDAGAAEIARQLEATPEGKKFVAAFSATALEI